MYSFYGGRPGNSFVIITTYRSIADMVSNFSQGPNYTAVHYDEYVMINTVNKNDPDNGKLYRRGYDFNNELGGAEYVGTIVGPAGKSPELKMTTVADVRTKYEESGTAGTYETGHYTITNNSLVPGRTGSGTYNDTITWAYCSVVNPNGDESVVYLGFTFPYFVTDWEVESKDPYVAGRYSNTVSIERMDDETHPFYAKWKLGIPKGVKGDTFNNLKVETASASVQPYDGRSDDINNDRKILTYDYYKYDTLQSGEPVKLYLGDYNMIEDVSIDNDGTITIEYTHDDDAVWNKLIKWISSVNINTSTGLFTVNYNQSTDAEGYPTQYSTYLDWIKSVSVNNNGTVSFGHTHGEDTTFSNLIKWVTGVTINNDGTITFTWNNGTSDTVFSNIVKWISAVNLAADGTLTVSYNNGSPDSVFSKTVKWITNVNVANDGTITFSYNNDDPDYVVSKKIKWISGMTVAANGTVTFTWNNGDNNTVYNNLMTWISDVSVNIESSVGAGEGTGNQKLHITWNDGTVEDIGNPINYIMSMAVNSSNHLLVKYSDPTKRVGGVTYNGTSGWTDLGVITHNYEYNVGDTVTGISWTGIGQLIDNGSGNKILRFVIPTTSSLNPNIATATVTAGTLSATDGTSTITNLALATAGVSTVTKIFTGLRFEVSTSIATSGSESSNFINISISGVGLSFNGT